MPRQPPTRQNNNSRNTTFRPRTANTIQSPIESTNLANSNDSSPPALCTVCDEPDHESSASSRF